MLTWILCATSPRWHIRSIVIEGSSHVPLDVIKTHILEEWHAISQAPASFVMAVLAIGLLIWLALSWSYSSRISHQSAEIKLLERRVADLQNQAPASARQADPYRWPPLVAEEIVTLRARLRNIRQRPPIQISYNPAALELAEGFRTVFEELNWPASISPSGQDVMGIRIEAQDSIEAARGLTDAIEAATNGRLKIDLQHHDFVAGPERILVTFGRKPQR
jgi:hypothetical protein